MNETTDPSLAGLRVLLVEDQIIIAMEVEELLRGCGCEVVGPAGRLSTAMTVARDAAMDVAILDVNLDGYKVWPVAETLRARDIPVVFCTGYSAATLPEAFSGSPVLDKPITLVQLKAALRACLATSPAGARSPSAPPVG